MSDNSNFVKKTEAKYIIDAINGEISEQFNKLKRIHIEHEY